MTALRLSAKFVFTIALAGAGYLAAALILGLFPVNADFKQPENGITIFVRTNGVHSDLALPVRTDTIDWAVEFPNGHFLGPLDRASYIGFGWGDREFYLKTKTWRDVDHVAAVKSLFGLQETVMHVQYMEPSRFSGEFIAVTLTTAQYERLVAYIRATLRRDGNGAAIPIDGAHYGMLDAFYAANGSYSAIYTCNEWVRGGLSVAGVRAPWWAPFDAALFYQLRFRR